MSSLRELRKSTAPRTNSRLFLYNTQLLEVLSVSSRHHWFLCSQGLNLRRRLPHLTEPSDVIQSRPSQKAKAQQGLTTFNFSGPCFAGITWLESPPPTHSLRGLEAPPFSWRSLIGYCSRGLLGDGNAVAFLKKIGCACALVRSRRCWIFEMKVNNLQTRGCGNVRPLGIPLNSPRVAFRIEACDLPSFSRVLKKWGRERGDQGEQRRSWRNKGKGRKIEEETAGREASHFWDRRPSWCVLAIPPLLEMSRLDLKRLRIRPNSHGGQNEFGGKKRSEGPCRVGSFECQEPPHFLQLNPWQGSWTAFWRLFSSLKWVKSSERISNCIGCDWLNLQITWWRCILFTGKSACTGLNL